MANVNKRYYWIQLAQDFFKSKEMKLLRKIAGGDTHTIIYLKMMLMSLEDGGQIFFDGVADNLAEEIALVIDEAVEDIKITLIFLESKGLLTRNSDREYFLEQVPEMVGSETASTRRSRKHREVKALQCNTDATKRNGDIEIDTEKDKDIKKDIDKDIKKDKQNFVQEVEANLGRGLVKFEFDMINDYLLNQKVSTELFLEAVKIAVANNVRKFNYIARILDNWINQGIKTPEQAFQAQRDFQARKNNKAMSANQKTGGNNPEWSNPDYKNATSPEKQAELERQKQELLKKMEDKTK